MDEGILPREQLELGKYTSWTLRHGLSREMLHALALLVGEFQPKASALFDVLWEERDAWRGAERAYLALEALDRFALGERYGKDEWARRMSRSRMRLEPAELPEAVRESMQAAAPGVAWDIALTTGEGYEVGGKQPAGKRLYAYLSWDGSVLQVSDQRERRRKDPSAIPLDLERKLEADKRTRWAVAREFSPEHLHCLLWLAGEFGARGKLLLDVLARKRAGLAGHERAVAALEHLDRMVMHAAPLPTGELERRLDRAGSRSP